MPKRTSWTDAFHESALLMVESQLVVGLRMLRFSQGGAGVHREAQRMVAEKIDAFAEATVTMASGGSAHTICKAYRRRVRANAKRLARG